MTGLPGSMPGLLDVWVHKMYKQPVGDKPQPCYNQIHAINDRVIMSLHCTYL